MERARNDGYEQAVLELHRAARDEFVAERKRLALALKAAGEKEAAARLAKLTRPSAAAWAVNQLWWRERARCEQLFASAARVRTADPKAVLEHRELLTSLREAATSLLLSAGQPASDATLRALSTNLAALAASGGFAPDLPGALLHDREPPGFEAMQGMAEAPAAPLRTLTREPASRAAPPAAPKLTAHGGAHAARKQGLPERRLIEEQRRLEQRRAAEQREREAQRRLAEQRAELERQEKERARRAELRRRLERERETANRERDACLRRVERLQSELASAEGQLAKAQARLNDVDAQLAEHGEAPKA